MVCVGVGWGWGCPVIDSTQSDSMSRMAPATELARVYLWGSRSSKWLHPQAAQYLLPCMFCFIILVLYRFDTPLEFFAPLQGPSDVHTENAFYTHLRWLFIELWLLSLFRLPCCWWLVHSASRSWHLIRTRLHVKAMCEQTGIIRLLDHSDKSLIGNKWSNSVIETEEQGYWVMLNKVLHSRIG